MSWIGILIAAFCLYLAFKVAGFFFKLLLWVVVFAALAWFAAPYLGWSPL